jgi:hypothetical protein
MSVLRRFVIKRNFADRAPVYYVELNLTNFLQFIFPSLINSTQFLINFVQYNIL